MRNRLSARQSWCSRRRRPGPRRRSKLQLRHMGNCVTCSAAHLGFATGGESLHILIRGFSSSNGSSAKVHLAIGMMAELGLLLGAPWLDLNRTECSGGEE